MIIIIWKGGICMAKKILKRSLALGALMAFVITGSAMAADNIIGNIKIDGVVKNFDNLGRVNIGTDVSLGKLFSSFHLVMPKKT